MLQAVVFCRCCHALTLPGSREGTQHRTCGSWAVLDGYHLTKLLIQYDVSLTSVLHTHKHRWVPLPRTHKYTGNMGAINSWLPNEHAHLQVCPYTYYTNMLAVEKKKKKALDIDLCFWHTQVHTLRHITHTKRFHSKIAKVIWIKEHQTLCKMKLEVGAIWECPIHWVGLHFLSSLV